MLVKHIIAAGAALAVIAVVSCTPAAAQGKRNDGSRYPNHPSVGARQHHHVPASRPQVIARSTTNITNNTVLAPYGNGCWNCGGGGWGYGGNPYDSGVAIAGINAGANVLLGLILNMGNNNRNAVNPGIQSRSY